MIKIVIPSYKRVGNIPNLEYLPKDMWKDFIYLAVCETEIEDYKKCYGDTLNYLVMDKGIGIRGTRQMINELMIGERIIVIDDDIIFQNTIIDGKGILRGNGELCDHELYQFLKWLHELMDKYEFGGFRTLMHPRTEDWLPYKLNKTIFSAYYFNLENGSKFDPSRFNFNDGPEHSEDMFIQLLWFDSGYDYPAITMPSIKQLSRFNAMSGGCNLENRREINERSIEFLNKKFPHLTSLHYSKAFEKHFGQPTRSIRLRLRRK